MKKTNFYRTSQGDLWDTISLRVYGTEMLMHILIEANHRHRHTAIFPANVELMVPDVVPSSRISFPPRRVG